MTVVVGISGGTGCRVAGIRNGKGVLRARRLFSGLKRSNQGRRGVYEAKYEAPRFPVPAVEGEKTGFVRKSVFSQLFGRFWPKASKETCLKETCGFMDFHDHRLYYKVFHPPKCRQALKTPILVLHGGPQMAHNYLENVGQLAFLGHPVIMFDQSGCGLSGAPADSASLSIEYLRDQVAFVMDELSVGDVHLLGHSSGGILALEYYLAYPESVTSLTLCSTPGDVALFMQEAGALTSQLPLSVQHAINVSWEHTKEEHKQAIDEFNKRFLCRLQQWPESLLKSFEMAGTSFRGVAAISDWRISSEDLARIDIPVLNISGRYDEVTPRCVFRVHSGIPSSEWVLFDNSSHMPFLEEPGKFINTLAKFLGRAEPSQHVSDHFTESYSW